MHRCNGRLFDGSACNNLLIECADCGCCGCDGDGCDAQLYTAATCGCGSAQRELAVALA